MKIDGASLILGLVDFGMLYNFRLGLAVINLAEEGRPRADGFAYEALAAYFGGLRLL